jgi:hypothetical protein
MPLSGVVLAAIASCLLMVGCTAPVGVPADPSDAEIDAMLRQQLDSRWESYAWPAGVAKPTVERVAFTTAETWSSTQVGCLQRAGIDAREVSGGFAVDENVDPAVARVAMWTCLAQYPRDPRGAGYLSEAQILYMYDFYVERLGPCMRLLGYGVSEPPAREEYVDLIRAGTYWSPYFAQGWDPQPIDVAKWRRVDFECGHLPADPYRSYLPLSWVEGR